MEPMPIRNLARLELFSGCPGRQLRGIDSLCTEIVVEPGRELCTEGDIGREFFVLTDGSVDVTRDGEPLAGLKSGDWFGEVALTSLGRRRIATVATTRASRVLVFDMREFRTMVARCPLVLRKLYASSILRGAAYNASPRDVCSL